MRRCLVPYLVAASAALAACGSDEAGSTDTGRTETAPAETAAPDVTETTAPDVTETTAPDDTETSAPDDGAQPGDSAGPDAADVEAEVETVVVGACTTDGPAGLAGCVEQARYEADLATVAVARPTWSAGWEATRELLAERLETLGFTVERHAYGVGTNIIGTRLGAKQPEQRVLVGAHYDSVPDCPGADDNGSGVAGALEVARVLAQVEHDRTLIVAFWDEEERGLIGSIAAATRMSRAGERIVAYFNFEMIGYFSDEPNSQQFPAGFELLFPEAAAAVLANENRGDFITNIGGDDAGPQLDALAKYGRALGLPTVNLTLTASLRASPLIGDLRRSDHAAFWAQGYPAIMLTDGANFRNSAYHCGSGPDAIARLDAARSAKVLAATVGAAAEALIAGQATAGAGGMPVGCDVTLQDCTGDKPKCSIADNGFGMFQNACVPSTSAAFGVGESCTRGPGGVGDDNCAAGNFCAFFGRPQGTPQERQCLKLCVSSSGCEAGEACIHWFGGALDAGLCVKTCDPFDPEACGAGLGCMYEWLEIEHRTFVASCDWAGSGAAESSCASSDCSPGLACVYDVAAGARVCRALCDAEHACDGDASCTPYPNTGLADRGTCVPR